jgi:proline iminopeptidase
MERLRGRLRIIRWLLAGGSQGSTPALTYPQRHPRRVTEIVLSTITTIRGSEADWLFRDFGPRCVLSPLAAAVSTSA